MIMSFIAFLILLGVLFLVAELVLLPGVTFGAILSLLCDGAAVYLAFRDYGATGGIAAFVIVVALSLAATAVCLRAKTWQRFSLRQRIESSSMPAPERTLRTGDRGVTVSRLSPMGKVEIGGTVYEAKSQDIYIDPRQEIEVVGFENFSVIVKLVK